MTARRRWRRTVTLGIAALALVVACSPNRKKLTAPPGSRLSPQIVAVSPPAHALSAVYDSDVWVQFAEPLNPATVNDHTVFLKVDDLRLPITVSYEPATYRIRIVSAGGLGLNTTYTVKLAADIESANGLSLGQILFWQFTTNSLFRPEATVPLPGSTFEGPFTGLAWVRGATTAQYEVYVGTDSAAIVSRAVPPRIVTTKLNYLPDPRWTSGTRYFWSVTAVNTTTRERLEGSTRSFTVVPDDALIDSLTVNSSGWAHSYFDPNTGLPNAFCGYDTMSSGPGYMCVIRWTLTTVARDRRLAGASLGMVANSVPGSLPTIWAVRASWTTCQIGLSGPPFFDADGKLADGVRDPVTNRLKFQSDRFTTHLEALARLSGYFGYSLRSSLVQGYASPASPNLANRPILKLYYYRTPPAPADAAPAPP